MILPDGEIRDRCWAIVATVADGRFGDIDALLDGLDREDVGNLVSGLAVLAVGFFLPRGTPWQDQGRRSRVAEALRTELLRRAAEGTPDDAA